MRRQDGVRAASSIILVRDGQPEPPAIFLVQRSKSSRFMGGQYVFPGGACDDTDHDPTLVARCRGMTPVEAAAILNVGPDDAIGHFVAAVRETFEEAGVLFAVTKSGDAVAADDVLGAREELGRTSLASILLSRDWYVDLGALRYYSHWITPTIEPRRFSARFFIAEVPPGQVAEVDHVEAVDACWMTPEEALQAYEVQQIGLPPPQLYTLSDLSHFRSMGAIIDHALHAPVTPHVPEFVPGPPPMLVLAGDRVHPSAPGSTERRFILAEGRWSMRLAS